MTDEPRNRRKSLYWTLGDEKYFLLHLGTGKWSRQTITERPELLRRYIKSIGYRNEYWSRRAKEYAEKLLNEEERNYQEGVFFLKG